MTVDNDAGFQDENRQHQDPPTGSYPQVERLRLSGHTFGRGMLPLTVEFSIDRAVSQGATACVYKGISLEPWSRVVAVKVYPKNIDVTREQLLFREMALVSHAALHHPRILPFLGTVGTGMRRYLVSLYMDNGNLLDYLKSHQGCDKKRLIVQVAEAVNYLHTEVCRVHGDLKCANVLISDAGDAFLGDFGLSHIADRWNTLDDVLEMYTLPFAAPELLFGYEDPRLRPPSKTTMTDVYAFGMLVLEAITEFPPWYGFNSLAIIQRVNEGEYPPQPISHGSTSMSPHWWAVCKACWNRNPYNRPMMDHVLSALKETDAVSDAQPRE